MFQFGHTVLRDSMCKHLPLGRSFWVTPYLSRGSFVISAAPVEARQGAKIREVTLGMPKGRQLWLPAFVRCKSCSCYALRRLANGAPAKPRPSSRSEAGSGVVVGGPAIPTSLEIAKSP